MWEMLLLASLSGAAAPVPAVDATRPPLVSPKRLIEMFLQNEAFADERYTDKVIHVRGKVVRISRNHHHNGEYLLHFDPEGAGQSAKLRLDLVISFPEEERKALAALNPGDVATVQGRCSQRVLRSGDLQMGLNEFSLVHVSACSLVPKEKPAPATPAPKEP
jgi:hypothetical protein